MISNPSGRLAEDFMGTPSGRLYGDAWLEEGVPPGGFPLEARPYIIMIPPGGTFP